MKLASSHDHFDPVPGFCDWATVGLPARATVAALHRCLEAWQQGRIDAAAFDADVAAACAAFAALVDAPVDTVAMPGAVSISAGLVASSLPDGATVLCAEEDFTSVLFPFLADERLDVRPVPLEALLDGLSPAVDLVAVSAVQSADGRVLDLDALATRAADANIRTFVDLTQAAGWLPIGAQRFDVTACSAYKWLAAPRGVGFLTVREDVDWLVPRLAGWYAGERPWESIYGPPLRLARDARRYTVSPAWFDVAATAAALQALTQIGRDLIHTHDVAVANRLRAAIDMPPSNSAIVSTTTRSDPAAALAAAGVAGASRGGRTRLAFHVTNSGDDADLAARVLRAHLA